MADILEIVVLSADAHAFLAGCRTLVRANLVAEKDIFKLVHSCVGK
jgi:hypothetical protein